MTNKDIYRNLGGIDPELIVEASKKRGNNGYGRVVKWASLAACLAIIVTAIPVTLILNREDPKAPAVTTPVVEDNKNPGTTNPPEVDPLNVIYCSADTLAQKEEFINNALINKDLEIKEFVQFDPFYINRYEMLEYSDDIPKKLSLNFGGKEYNCIFMSVYNTFAARTTDDNLKKYARVAKYYIEGGSNDEKNGGYAFYQVDTQRLVGISVSNPSKLQSIKGSLDKDKISSLAKKDLSKLYGEKLLSKYEMTCQKISYDGNRELFVIDFIKKIGEFDTTERITVKYNTAGMFLSLSTRDLGVFDTVENTINEKLLLATEAEALKVYDGKLVDHKYLMIGNDGKPYIFTCLKYADGDKLKLYELHYKINMKLSNN